MAEDIEKVGAAKVTGIVIMIGIGISLTGWLMLFIFPPLTFILWGLGGVVAVLSIPIGLAVWFGQRAEDNTTTA